jgi:hypothetical protein
MVRNPRNPEYSPSESSLLVLKKDMQVMYGVLNPHKFINLINAIKNKFATVQIIYKDIYKWKCHFGIPVCFSVCIIYHKHIME